MTERDLSAKRDEPIVGDVDEIRCSACGQQGPDGAVFCLGCGSPLVGSSAKSGVPAEPFANSGRRRNEPQDLVPNAESGSPPQQSKERVTNELSEADRSGEPAPREEQSSQDSTHLLSNPPAPVAASSPSRPFLMPSLIVLVLVGLAILGLATNGRSDGTETETVSPETTTNETITKEPTPANSTTSPSETSSAPRTNESEPRGTEEGRTTEAALSPQDTADDADSMPTTAKRTEEGEDVDTAELALSRPAIADDTDPAPTATASPSPTATTVPSENSGAYLHSGRFFDLTAGGEYRTTTVDEDVGYGFRTVLLNQETGREILIDVTPGISEAEVQSSAANVAKAVDGASATRQVEIGDTNVSYFSWFSEDGTYKHDGFFVLDGIGFAVVVSDTSESASLDLLIETIRSIETT